MPATDATANTDTPAVDAITAALDQAQEARDTRNREDRLRRKLAKTGHRLQKAPARDATRWFGVGYQIVNDRNVVVEGCGSREYQLTLGQAEAFAAAANGEGT